jgi:hypothetical protein
VGRKLVAGMLLAGVAGCAAVPALAGKVAGPTARATQFEDPYWNCKKFTKQGDGASKRHTVGSWGPGSGARVYKVRYRVKAQKCRRWTRVLYYLYLDASTLPSDRHVLFQFQSRGRRHKWRAACVKKRCLFSVDGGTKVPRFGAQPIAQFRVTTKALLNNTRIRLGVVQGQPGYGEWVAAPNKTYHAAIHYH